MIDTKTGDTVEWLRIEGVVRELFDVVVLPGVRNSAAIGFVTDGPIRATKNVGDYWCVLRRGALPRIAPKPEAAHTMRRVGT